MKNILKYLLALLICTIVGYLLIVFSYCLPINSIKENVLITSKIYTKEWDFPQLIRDNEATTIGNHTDELMLLESIYDGDENVFEKAVMAYRKEIPNNEYRYTLEKLDDIYKGIETTETISYPRYWHGYLVILKPLLMIFNHNQIKYINLILQTVLLIYVLFLMYKNKLKKYIITFLLSNLVLYPPTIAFTMQYSIVYYILLIQLILLLKYKWFDNNFNFFMFLSGITTCYFDYFTWPLVTIGIPLIFKVIMGEESIKSNFKTVMFSSVLWLLGYATMWFMKFGLGSLIVRQNLFIDGINQMTLRSSALDANHSLMVESIFYNINRMLNNRVNLLLIVVFILTIILLCLKKKYVFDKKRLINNLPILLVCLYPIIWFLIVTNHSYVHYYMIYRILLITIFGILAYILSAFISKKDNY